jgi:hypothetical protein
MAAGIVLGLEMEVIPSASRWPVQSRLGIRVRVRVEAMAMALFFR